LAAETPNDGSQSIVFPNVEATDVRIKIEAVENIFFDITDADLAMAAVPAATLGDDSLVGTAADDRIEALRGRDTVRGGEGNDPILGQGDDDQLHGGVTYRLREVNGSTQIRLNEEVINGDLISIVTGVTGLNLSDSSVFSYV
jgi:RTX calcium-binding nonapeptide repeat (4 copies)